MALKDKLVATNTVSTRYGFLINLLLDPEYKEFGELIGVLSSIRAEMNSTIDYVLEQEGKFQKSFEGIMSWQAINVFLGKDLLEKIQKASSNLALRFRYLTPNICRYRSDILQMRVGYLDQNICRCRSDIWTKISADAGQIFGPKYVRKIEDG